MNKKNDPLFTDKKVWNSPLKKCCDQSKFYLLQWIERLPNGKVGDKNTFYLIPADAITIGSVNILKKCHCEYMNTTSTEAENELEQLFKMLLGDWKKYCVKYEDLHTLTTTHFVGFFMSGIL